jgi:hypothetical protein
MTAVLARVYSFIFGCTKIAVDESINESIVAKKTEKAAAGTVVVRSHHLLIGQRNV